MSLEVQYPGVAFLLSVPFKNNGKDYIYWLLLRNLELSTCIFNVVPLQKACESSCICKFLGNLNHEK